MHEEVIISIMTFINIFQHKKGSKAKVLNECCAREDLFKQSRCKTKDKITGMNERSQMNASTTAKCQTLRRLHLQTYTVIVKDKFITLE